MKLFFLLKLEVLRRFLPMRFCFENETEETNELMSLLVDLSFLLSLWVAEPVMD